MAREPRPLVAREKALIKRLFEHEDIEAELRSDERVIVNDLVGQGLITLSETGRWAGLTQKGWDYAKQLN